ncbi:MAG: hypothetical protein BGO47_06540 [Microbacterium sp. 67-17]|uniref:acyl-CoA thioesterase n=1 Tax=Microbacterium sp. 67-17 TaxID=1895782 RepID=UPI00095E1033|nr:acyl-CoA thioesterase domain-containing protein [Microbacterium sp. 67-17]OJV93577.1 MAG: hypothetical protein BGO47_06540 [Microbacterium sp. 67-17]
MSEASGFLAAVALSEDGTGFTARTQPVPWPKSYGGDLLAQAAAAATRTVADDRALHAIHSLFVAPATVGAVLRYDVETLRNGRSYSSRRVTATEDGRVVLSALASFHVGEDSPRVAATPQPAPAPTELADARTRAQGAPAEVVDYWADGRSFELRHVGPDSYVSDGAAPGPAEVRLWLRALDGLGEDPALHRLALVYVCDYAMLEPALRAQGWAWTDPGLATASLDHSLWLHEDARLDDWLLCELRLVSHSNGRALVEGEFFTADGVHVASVAQQGMIRRLSAAS